MNTKRQLLKASFGMADQRTMQCFVRRRVSSFGGSATDFAREVRWENLFQLDLGVIHFSK